MESSDCKCDQPVWSSILSTALIGLNIIISIGKQFLNNNKHSTNQNVLVETIKSISKERLYTEAEGLNIPEQLKTSNADKKK